MYNIFDLWNVDGSQENGKCMGMCADFLCLLECFINGDIQAKLSVVRPAKGN